MLGRPPVHAVVDDPLPREAVINASGSLVDVEAGGNCGHLALIWGLHNHLKLEARWSVDDFREAVKHPALENEERLFGTGCCRLSHRKRSAEEHQEFEKGKWSKTLNNDQKKRKNAPRRCSHVKLVRWS
jgi:hypothetical protein